MFFFTHKYLIDTCCYVPTFQLDTLIFQSLSSSTVDIRCHRCFYWTRVTNVWFRTYRCIIEMINWMQRIHVILLLQQYVFLFCRWNRLWGQWPVSNRLSFALRFIMAQWSLVLYLLKQQTLMRIYIFLLIHNFDLLWIVHHFYW